MGKKKKGEHHQWKMGFEPRSWDHRGREELAGVPPSSPLLVCSALLDEARENRTRASRHARMRSFTFFLPKFRLFLCS